MEENLEAQTEAKTPPPPPHPDLHIPQNTPWPVAERGTSENVKDGGGASERLPLDNLGTGVRDADLEQPGNRGGRRRESELPWTFLGRLD